MGFDCKMWQCRANAQETQFAVSILLAPYVDMSIVFPNGNRLAKQQESSEPKWLKKCCEEVATALAMTSVHTVAFVGEASMVP